MKKPKMTTYPGLESRYVSPLLELLSIEGSGVLCESGHTEDYIDNEDPDWFTN